MGAIDVRLAKVELATITQVFGDARENAMQSAVFNPLLIAPMTRLVRRVARRKIGPRSARAQHPQHRVQHVARVAERTTSLRRRAVSLLLREERLDDFPLLVREIHQDRRSNFRAHVDPRRESDRIPRTYERPVMRCVLVLRHMEVAARERAEDQRWREHIHGQLVRHAHIRPFAACHEVADGRDGEDGEKNGDDAFEHFEHGGGYCVAEPRF